MYIQITDKCNMSCEHCFASCTAAGTFMSMDIFLKACELAEEYGEYITIGGGEPTLHPNFWEIVGLSLAYSEEMPFIVTNGSNTDISLKLAKLHEKKVMQVNLSQDHYHDPIDDEVIEKFEELKAIRNVSNRILPVGRAVETGTANTDEFRCPCSNIFIDPEGNIFACGCKTVSLGTVFDPKLDDLYDMPFKEEFDCPVEYEKELEEVNQDA